MASLQLPVLPRVKENPTALMLNEELQRAQQSRQCLGLGELQMGSATRKVPKTQGTCWPPTTLRLLALCCFPAHAPNVNQILTTSHSWPLHPTGLHFGNARPTFQEPLFHRATPPWHLSTCPSRYQPVISQYLLRTYIFLTLMWET
jgi:hypothetical protein